MRKKDKLKNNGSNPVESNSKITKTIEVLKIQLQEHLQKTEYHKTMATKAQGALEVLLQMHPDKEAEEMVANAETKDNHQEASVAN